MRKNRKGTNSETIQWDESERRNAIELDAMRLAAKRALTWRMVIILFMLVSCASIVVAGRSTGILSSMGAELGARFSALAADKPGREAALEAVNAWLDDAAFPDGTDNLIWDDATKVGETAPTQGDTTSKPVEYWSHQLEFTDLSDGSTRVVTQLVAVEDGVYTAVGDPTVMGKAAETPGGSQEAYKPSGYNSLDQNESLNNVLSQWAEAYVASDPTSLTVLVADPNPEHAYQPAAVGKFASLSINWLVECTEDGQPVAREDRQKNPEFGAASVTISYNPYFTAKGDDSDNEKRNATARMNITLLLHTPLQGSAKVLDWGPDGSLTTLKKYSHALDRSLVKSSDDDDEDEDAQDGGTGEGTDTTGTDTTDTDTDAEQPTD